MQEPELFFREGLPIRSITSFPAHPVKRLQFIAGRFLLKQLQANFAFDQLAVTDAGRPYLLDRSLQFSISHAGSMVAAIIHPQSPVGIDVETISLRAYRIRHKFLSNQETTLIEQAAAMYEQAEIFPVYTLAWSVKEAAFKALQQTGVDFIRDLPIVAVNHAGYEWSVKLGGKGGGLEIVARFLDSVCVAWVESRE